MKLESDFSIQSDSQIIQHAASNDFIDFAFRHMFNCYRPNSLSHIYILLPLGNV